MNCKFLKQALGLVIGIGASINVVHSMDNSKILNSANVSNQESEVIIIKLQNIKIEEEKTLLQQVNQNRDYSHLINLCEKNFNYDSSPEEIVNFIIESAECINKTSSLHNKLCNAIYTIIQKKCTIRDIRDNEFKSNYNNSKIIQKLIKDKFEEVDDILGKVLMKHVKCSELKGNIKDLSKRVKYMSNVDKKLINDMNKALDSIVEEK